MSLMFTLMSYQVIWADTNVTTNAVTLTVNGSALLAIKTGTSINLSLSGATEAGAAIQTVAADSTARLRISSLVNGSLTRSISAKLDVQPVGANLFITVMTPTTTFTSGTGVKGTLLPDVMLSSSTANNIITNIGTCWSGTVSDAGYVIKYTYKMIDGATVVTGANVVVTYTLSDPA